MASGPMDPAIRTSCGAASRASRAIAQAECSELGAIGAEGIRLDDLCSGLDIGLMNAEDGFGLGDVQLLEAALRAGAFKQH